MEWPLPATRPDNEPMPVTARPSTSTDLARNLAVASLAVIQIVVAGHGRERRAGGGRRHRRPLVPHARAARGLDVRHLGRDLPRLRRLCRLPAVADAADACGASGHGLVARGVGGAQHGVGQHVLGTVRPARGGAAPRAARGAGPGVRPAESRAGREHAGATGAAPARGALHRMGLPGRGGRNGGDRGPAGPAGRRCARRDRGRADPARRGGDRRERGHLRDGRRRVRGRPRSGRWWASR